MRLRLAVLVTLALAGCAGDQAFREGSRLVAEGRTREGLASLEAAVRERPGSAEYRIALARARSDLVEKNMAAGERARRAGRPEEAQRAFEDVLAIDPANVAARSGLAAIAREVRQRELLAGVEARIASRRPQELADAEARLRAVLAESPGHAEAVAYMERLEAAKTRAAVVESSLGPAFAKPISLEFKEAPLRSVFDFIARLSGLNVFFDKDVKTDQKVNVTARNSSVDDAVRILLMTNQLDRRILNDSSILVFPNTPAKQKEYQPLSVRAFYLTNADVKGVSNTLKTLLKTRDMVVDERLGMIILRDTPEAIRVAERVVSLQDLGDPEVVLEVEILEVKRSRLTALGIQWPSQLTLTPLPSGTALTLADLRHLSSSTLQAAIGGVSINANSTADDANLLANPRIRVRNKEKAKVLIGDRVPTITTTSTSTGFVAESVTYVDVGLKLEVEPMVYLDEEVAIRISLEVSSLVNQVVSKAGTITYQIGTRGATTALRLRDGETQVLAGLISDEERASANRIPGLGHLPLAGRLFGSRNDNSARGEILLSITPRVVRSLRRAALTDAEFGAGTESSVGAESLRLKSMLAASGSSAVPGAGASGSPADAGRSPRDQRPVPPAEAAPTGGSSASPVPGRQPASPAATPATSGSLQAVDAGQGALSSGTPASLSWQVTPQVKAGDEFDAFLSLRSIAPLHGLPVAVGFDPAHVRLVSVSEGSYFAQAGGRSAFSFRVEESQGQVFVETGRESGRVDDAGVSGTGTVALLRFQALKGSGAPSNGPVVTALRVLSVGAEPSSTPPISVPTDQSIRILP